MQNVMRLVFIVPWTACRVSISLEVPYKVSRSFLLCRVKKHKRYFRKWVQRTVTTWEQDETSDDTGTILK